MIEIAAGKMLRQPPIISLVERQRYRRSRSDALQTSAMIPPATSML
jgi:hypothetical protein